MNKDRSRSPQADIKQDYNEAVQMCKTAAAEAAAEHTTQRRKNLQGLVVSVFLIFILILGMRKMLSPKVAAPDRVVPHLDARAAEMQSVDSVAAVKAVEEVPPPPYATRAASAPIDNPSQSPPRAKASDANQILKVDSNPDTPPPTSPDPNK
ncbi:hypothetical protein DIPPA_24858 [Diplonema papillatum]|nr:hypothetical protein DIPPA_24858 [Diplonema papillatum]